MDGLNLYETILLGLGVALFLVLVFLLVDRVRKNQGYSALLPFFLVPVLMIAFPAVHEIEFDNLMIQMNASLSLAGKGDPQARKTLKDTLAAAQRFRITGERNKATLLAAQALLDGKAKGPGKEWAVKKK